ncbi:MAG: U32 family peptidase [Ruminococcaceae bacterium]|nr:U32 family peptidase [Oscillospiraceae bacterium]
MSLPELLAPCGSPEAMKAAVFGGADAVYLGGSLFNARMNAKNFTDDALAEAVRFCHERGVRVYVTLNTLILDREMKQALEYAFYLYNIGVDALITADLGLSALIRRHLPDFELHASTQACGSTVKAAEAFASLGFSRMVCPREYSLSDLKTLTKASPIEIEMFVHGAICVCFSGQCLFSSMVGNRSGNRGQCAQPCRMAYNGNAFPLSLKDMCLASHITEILDSGVASLKIEGRMKSPDYVYSVVSTYRRLLDEKRNASPKEIERMESVFSRSGFTDGYFTEKITPAMVGIRRDSDKSKTKQVHVSIRDVGHKNPKIENRKALPITLDLPKITEERPYFFTRSARFSSPNAIPQTDYFDNIYLPIESFESDCGANGIVMPPFLFDREEHKAAALIDKAVQKGAKNVLVTHIGQLPLLKDSGLTLHGDYRLNLFNTAAHELCLSLADFKTLMLSPELTLPQIRDIPFPKSAIVYGRLPLMSLYKPCGAGSLTDRTKADFPVIREFSRDIVLNSVPFYNAEKITDLKKTGLNDLHFLFTTESKREVLDIIEAHKKKLPSKNFSKKLK